MKYKWFFNPYSKYEIIEETEDWLYCKEKENFNVDYENNFWANYLTANKEFSLDKEAFENCPFKEKIFKNYNVIGICFSGSKLYNCMNNNSDYDIAVFLDKNPDLNHKDTECLFYKGVKVHWYYLSFDKLLDTSNNGICLFNIELYFLTDKNILFGNLIDVINNKKNLTVQNINLFLANNINLLETKRYCKSTAYLILCYYILNELNLEPDLINSLKLYDWIKIENNNDIDKKLNWLLNYTEGMNLYNDR